MANPTHTQTSSAPPMFEPLSQRELKLKKLVERYRRELGVVLDWFFLRQKGFTDPGSKPLPELTFVQQLKASVTRIDKEAGD